MKINILYLEKKNSINLILLFTIIYLSFGFLFKNDIISNKLSFIFWIIEFIILLLINNKKK